MPIFKPKLLTTLKGYNKSAFVKDLIAGIVVGIIALPLAIAFAIASGVSPEKGLYTSIIAGFIISAFGGSRVQIGGPTGAFIVIVYGIVQQYGIAGLTIATFIAGIMLILMGLIRLGSVIKFIPHPLIVGFTSGIALIIFSSQMKDLFGLRMGTVPAEFLDKWKEYILHFGSVNPYALGIGIFTILVTFLMPRLTTRFPGSLAAIILTTAAVAYLGWPVETIGSRFGAIPSTLPLPVVPDIDLKTVRELIGPAFTIALLGGIESLLSAVVADGMIGSNHRSNTELIAQGGANIFSSIFGGIPATGAIARTATNVKNGGRTPVAGMIHAVTLLIIMLFAGQFAGLIPLSCLAGILLVVAYNMSEWHAFLGVVRGPRSDAAILLTTFFLTVLVDLTVAIEIGMILALFLFMRRMTKVTNIEIVTKELDDRDEKDDPLATSKYEIPESVEVFEIDGPFFFGAAYKFTESIRIIERTPRVLIIRMRYVPFIDATGLHTLNKIHAESRRQGFTLILSGIRPEIYSELEHDGILDKIGKENVLGDIGSAVRRAREIIAV